MSARAASRPSPLPSHAAKSASEDPFPFWKFLRQEFAPYPGRVSVVIRMVATATATMLCIMAGHLPEGALGAYFALLIVREDLRATYRNTLLLIAFFGMATVYVLLGAALFTASPLTHFLWVVGSLLLLFFVLSAGANYSLAGAFAMPVIGALPIWDRPYSVNAKISLTLYLFFTLAIGSFSGLLVEAVYRTFNTTHPILAGLADRLRVSAAMLLAAADNKDLGKDDTSKLLQYAMIGPSALRRHLIRSGQGTEERARVAAAISLNGRLVELCAAALHVAHHKAHIRVVPDSEEARRLRAVSAAMQARAAELRTLPGTAAIGTSSLPRWTASDTPSKTVPTLPEIEHMVSFFGQILDSFDDAAVQENRAREASPHYGMAAARRKAPWAELFKPDAFTNREHLIFALRGSLAATLCYLIYKGVDWPGIDTAVATCAITALATVGSSRQKQVLRITGAVLGGFVIALPAQVYLLPHIDSIAGFTLFFAAVSLLVAWLSTTSPRLSYLGLQAALAFYLVNLQEPYEQVSLAVSRDRVVGVLLGLAAMWLVFDRIGSTDATRHMEVLLQANLLRIGAYGLLTAELTQSTTPELLAQAQAMRGEINDAFSQMNAQADAVLFEFGPRRADKLRTRARMQAMQPAMRSIFLTEIALYEADHTMRGAHRVESGRPALSQFFMRSRDVLQAVAAELIAGAGASEAALQRLREALPVLELETGDAHKSMYRLCESLARSLESMHAEVLLG